MPQLKRQRNATFSGIFERYEIKETKHLITRRGRRSTAATPASIDHASEQLDAPTHHQINANHQGADMLDAGLRCG